MDDAERERLYTGWTQAVLRTLRVAEDV